MSESRNRLAAAQLYLICAAGSDELLHAALGGGVDIVQLRMKDAADGEIVRTGRRVARACAEHGALFILNDRPDLVEDAGAAGVHLGQDDVSTGRARELLGPDRVVGLSTHSTREIEAVGSEVDYIGVGPVHETPTKPGRPAVGLELVRYAAGHARQPFFAIGGIDSGNVASLRAAGARRIAVVRALTEAEDPRRAARELRVALGAEREAGVGSA